MNKFNKHFFKGCALVLGMITMGISPSLSDDKANPSTPEKVVNVYSGRHYDSDIALFDSFTKKTGIKVNLVESKVDELLARIEQEGEKSPADVLITVDAGRIWRAEEAKLLQTIQSDVVKKAVPAHLRHPDGLWVALAKRARVFVYAADRLKPENLSTYEDLADPKWKSKVLVRSSNNVYNQSLVAALIEKHGAAQTENWIKGLVGNFARAPEGGDTDQIKALAAGVGDVAIVNHYYFARLLASSKPEEKDIVKNLKVFFPNQNAGGTHMNISAAAVLKNAPNKDHAVQLIEFLVSPEAQEQFAKASMEYPVIENIALDPSVAALGKFKEDAIDVTSYGKNQKTAVMLMDKGGWK